MLCSHFILEKNNSKKSHKTPDAFLLSENNYGESVKVRWQVGSYGLNGEITVKFKPMMSVWKL